MASYHNTLSKTDRALVAYLISQEAGAAENTFPAKRSLDKALPCTICSSEKAVEDPPFSSSYQVTSAVMVRCPAPVDVTPTEPSAGETQAPEQDALAAAIKSDQRVAAVGDALHMSMDSAGDKLAEAITAAARKAAAEDPDHFGDLADFTCLDVIDRGTEAGFTEDGSAWVDTFNLELTCVPKNVS
jgi:hypothetical protein